MNEVKPISGYEQRRLRIVEKIRHDLAAGFPVTDRQFDQTLSSEMFQLSKVHWTPVEVTLAALAMLKPSPTSRILDVGAGCGKFCIVAALASVGHYTGIEIRSHLVEAAQQNRELFRASRVDFLLGDMADLDWSNFTGFYLYNPFWENKIVNDSSGPRVIDNSLNLDYGQFLLYTDIVRRKLAQCPRGTRVVTYHGFGSDLPIGFIPGKTELHGSGNLELWLKHS